MKRNYLFWLTALTIPMFLGCSSKGSGSYKEIDFTKLKKITVDNKNLNGQFELDSLIDKNSVRFVHLETNVNSTIGIVSSLFQLRDRIIIFDFNTKKISTFKNDGTFINNLGRYGKGPSEYLQPLDVKYNPYSKTVDVNDVGYQFKSYDVTTGGMVSSKKNFLLVLQGAMFQPIGNARYAVYDNFHPAAEKDRNYRFSIISSGDVIRQFLKFDGEKEFSVPVSGGQFFEWNGNHFFFERGFPVVYQITDYDLKPAYYISYTIANTKYKSPDAEDLHQENKQKKLPEMNSILETEHFMFIDYVIDYVRQNSIFDKRANKSLGISSQGYVIKALGLSLNSFFYTGRKNEIASAIPATQIIDLQAKLKNKKSLSMLESKLMKLKVSEFDNSVLLYFTML